MEEQDTQVRSWGERDGQFRWWGQGGSSQGLLLAGGPCMNQADRRAPARSLGGHKSYALFLLASLLVATTPLLPQSLLEPVLCGREAVAGHLWQRPWGMTHIRRRTQGHPSHLVIHSLPKDPTDRGSRDTQGYTRGQLCHSGPRGLSSAQASAGTSSGLVNRWGGRPRERPEPLARAGHAPRPDCPAAPSHHPGSRVSTGMTLLIPAHPAPQLLIGPVMCMEMCLCTDTHVCTRAHTEVRIPSLKPLLTLTPQLYPPLATHLLSFIPITGPTYVSEQKTLTCQMALKRPWPMSTLLVHGPRLAQFSGLMLPPSSFAGAQVKEIKPVNPKGNQP